MQRHSEQPEPQPSDDSSRDLDRIEELVAEGVERWAAEGPAALEDLCARHPELADELREQFDLLGDTGVLGETDEDEPEFPDRLGKYRLLSRLGGGGMGVVFLAREEPLQRSVAIKLIRPDQAYFEGSRKRFRREMEAISRLQHPGIVPVYALEESKGVPFFVMENVQGCTLAEVLKELQNRAAETLSAQDLAEAIARRTPGEVAPPKDDEVRRRFGRTWPEACMRLLLQIAEALDHAHRRGVLHRDVKPSNIMVTPDGRALLLDFGLARSLDADELTRTGSHLGSLPYMAPEQLTGKGHGSEGRVDVYALGVTMYELLARFSPYLRGDGEATRAAVLDGHPTSLRQVVPHLSWEAETVCYTAMNPEVSQRYATAGDFARDLHNVLEGRSIMARRPSTLRRARRWIARHPTLSVFLILCGVIFVFSVGLAIERDNSIKKFREMNAQREAAEEERDQFGDDRASLYWAHGLNSLAAREAYLWPPRPEVVERPGGMNKWREDANNALASLLQQANYLKKIRSKGRYVPIQELDSSNLQVERRLERRQRLLDEIERAELHGGGAAGKAVADLRAELAAVDRELSDRWCWKFDEVASEYWNDYFSQLTPRYEELRQLVERVDQRYRLAMETGPRSLEDAREAWERVVAEVASDPRYGGLSLAPQWGLVPLGRDPKSGLQEFLHLLSADPSAPTPSRDAAGGLPQDQASGLTLVLIPPRAATTETPALDAFFLAKDEMNRAQWARLTGKWPSRGSGVGLLQPVDSVSWHDARRALANIELLLPTVAQWRAAKEDAAAGLRGIDGGVREWARDVPATADRPAGAGDGEVWVWRGARHAVLGASARSPAALGEELPDAAIDDLGLRPVRPLDAAPSHRR